MATSTSTIPEGRYAVTGKTGEVRFYRVTVGKSGKWKGVRFIVRLIADGGHDYAEVKITDAAHRRAVLAWIARNPEEFSKAYGLKSGRCGMCNRVLSDDASLAAGIGPICAGKAGW